MFRSSIAGLLVAVAGASAAAQGPHTAGNGANGLIRKVVDHELKADSEDHTHWMYKDAVYLPGPAKVKTVVETQNGDLTCLDEIDNHPLTPEQRNAESQRIRRFVADAGAQRTALKASADDDEKTTHLFSILPDAFVFRFDQRNGDTARLAFEPNPRFHAHSMEEFVFHRMSGYVVVNTREDRLVEISGALTHGVEFAGGLLGHLDPGGTFDVRLMEVAPNVWKVDRLKVNMHGKVLFFKTIGDQEDETRSDFRQMAGGMTLAQAAQLLVNQARSTSAGE